MTPEEAAVKRAAKAARRAMVSLDAAGARELRRAYREAADDLRRVIAQHAGPEDSVTLAQLRDLLRQVEDRLARLGALRDEIIDEGLQRAAQYGAAAATVSGDAAMIVSDRAVRFVRAFIAADGLQLADRIWRNDRQARDAVTGALERAVIEGHHAAQAARDFLSRGEGVPADLARKVGAASTSRLALGARDALTGDGNAMDNAMRLFRTEINRAHGEAYMAGGEDVRGFAGWRYLLSPAHPEHDICDLYAAQNLHGLGPGVYPTRERTPWPAHPNTLSFVEIVFESEITEEDRKGKETTMQALARLSPAARRGVLGKSKAEAFEDGRITPGMIRAPWRVVQQRIANNRARSGWEWDDSVKDKFSGNIKKHNRNFNDIAPMMRGKTFTFLSPREDERRWVTVGELHGEVLYAVYTERGGKTRAISFRTAEKVLRDEYRRRYP